ncbi:sirohydrochlorin chelatase, partial [Staphylococcus sp. EG-SA-2]|nr:sirohydrochlorin chelatase [Staphylococcus sp. EG-SA-2]
TPSINFDPILKQIINDRLESLMIPMKI